jgi:hypothetical protein
MVISLILISFLFVLISFATYRWLQSKSSQTNEKTLPPAPAEFASLFALDEKSLTEFQRAEEEARKKNEKLSLLDRATRGDKEALIEASEFGDRSFYAEVLDVFVERANTSEELWSLASFISDKKGLRANTKLARACLDDWLIETTRSAVAKALHIAALSDDATLYQEAIEKVFELWKSGTLHVEATELRNLAESEFWILADEARNSGAGFLLKQSLASVNRELAATATRGQ